MAQCTCRYVEPLGFVRTKRAGFFNLPQAEVAELADALDSGSSALTGVRVQIPASAPTLFPRSYQAVSLFHDHHS